MGFTPLVTDTSSPEIMPVIPAAIGKLSAETEEPSTIPQHEMEQLSTMASGSPMKTFSPFPSTNLSVNNYSGVLRVRGEHNRPLEVLLRDPGEGKTSHYITLYTSLPSLTLEAFWDQEWTVQVWADRDTDSEQIIYQVPEKALWEDSWEGPFWDQEASKRRIQILPSQEFADAQHLAHAISSLLAHPPRPTQLLPQQLVHIDSQIAPSWHYLQEDQHVTIFLPSVAQPPQHTYLSVWLPDAMVESFALYKNEEEKFFIVAHDKLTEESTFIPLQELSERQTIADIFGRPLDLSLLCKNLPTIFADIAQSSTGQ